MSNFDNDDFAEQVYDEIMEMSVGAFIEKYGFSEVEDLVIDAVDIEFEIRGE